MSKNSVESQTTGGNRHFKANSINAKSPAAPSPARHPFRFRNGSANTVATAVHHCQTAHRPPKMSMIIASAVVSRGNICTCRSKTQNISALRFRVGSAVSGSANWITFVQETIVSNFLPSALSIQSSTWSRAEMNFSMADQIMKRRVQSCLDHFPGKGSSEGTHSIQVNPARNIRHLCAQTCWQQLRVPMCVIAWQNCPKAMHRLMPKR